MAHVSVGIGLCQQLERRNICTIAQLKHLAFAVRAAFSCCKHQYAIVKPTTLTSNKYRSTQCLGITVNLNACNDYEGAVSAAGKVSAPVTMILGCLLYTSPSPRD